MKVNEGKMTPKISIVIPVYNTEKYLKECLESVINQTFTDWEGILVNDGSTDSSGKILNEYAKKDSRFSIVTQKNQGLSMARNNGQKKATGDYIYFLDSDDLMHPQLLEISFFYAEKFNADMVSFAFFKSDKEKLDLSFIDKEKIAFKVTDNPVFLGTHKEKWRIHFNTWAKLFKKEILNNIEFIKGIRYEDYPHTFQVMAKNPKTVVLQSKLYYYRKNENSISNQAAQPSQINDYQTGIEAVFNAFFGSHKKKERAFLMRNFLPNILKQQYGKCQRSPVSIRPQMLTAFQKELQHLNEKGLLSLRGHKLKRYFIYKKLIKG